MPGAVIAESSSKFGFRAFFKKLRWVTHPITVFVSLQIFLVSVITIWVVYFVDKEAELAKLAKLLGSESFDNRYAIVILVVGCILLGMALVATTILFVQSQKRGYLIELQRSFVSSVTHELRSPIASLQLALETLNSRELKPEMQKKLFTMSLADIERLRRLVEQILVSGRLDRGVPVFGETPEKVPLKSAIENVIASSKFLDEKVEERVTIDCADDMHLMAPGPAVNIILTNLIENAVKYSPKDTEITIECSKTSWDTAVIMVKDQGMGLDKHEQRRIFRMFHRAPQAAKKAIPGTGLGLFIVRQTVRSLRGKIWVESAGRDQGSTFYVELPGKLPKGKA